MPPNPAPVLPAAFKSSVDPPVAKALQSAAPQAKPRNLWAMAMQQARNATGALLGAARNSTSPLSSKARNATSAFDSLARNATMQDKSRNATSALHNLSRNATRQGKSRNATSALDSLSRNATAAKQQLGRNATAAVRGVWRNNATRNSSRALLQDTTKPLYTVPKAKAPWSPAPAPAEAPASPSSAELNKQLPHNAKVKSTGLIPLKVVAGISSSAAAQGIAMIPGASFESLKKLAGTEGAE